MHPLLIGIALLGLVFAGAFYMLIKVSKEDDKVTDTNKSVQGKKKTKGNTPKENLSTTQAFVNIKNIDNYFVETLDGHLYTYLKIEPISVDLLSSAEQSTLISNITSSISKDNVDFKFICLSRPVDIEPILNQYHEIAFQSDNYYQKALLKAEADKMRSFAMSGEVIQRQFYIMLWEKQSYNAVELLNKRALSFVEYFSEGGIKLTRIKDKGIYQMFNLFTNPSTATVEDFNIEDAIPIMFFNTEMGGE